MKRRIINSMVKHGNHTKKHTLNRTQLGDARACHRLRRSRLIDAGVGVGTTTGASPGSGATPLHPSLNLISFKNRKKNILDCKRASAAKTVFVLEVHGTF